MSRAWVPKRMPKKFLGAVLALAFRNQAATGIGTGFPAHPTRNLLIMNELLNVRPLNSA